LPARRDRSADDPTTMSLRLFLNDSLDDILSEWEKDSGLPAGEQTARRLHFGKVLRAVAEEMNRMSASQATAVAAAAAAIDEDARRRGDGGEPPHSHAGQLVDDYASLRASVLRQWRQKHPSPSAVELDELVHFNEAMDRSLAELSATFSPSRSQPNALFLGVLNHELRTLVASILMSAQVLTHRSAPGSPEGKAAQRILRSCEQLRQTLDALSDFTKVRLGSAIELDRVDEDMGVLCRQALDEYARIDRERKVRLASDGDLHGHWDAPRIRDAIRGLIANAARLASRGSAVTIVVDGDAADEVKVTVHGDGMPIDLDTLRTIFDPVARVESDNATYAGLGLGLFIVRKVVDAHGGQVSVDASPEHGTTFTVVLPRRP
jgi:signal transduction histidine kinase